MPTKKFNVRRLVSNRPGDAAKQDINLVNAWGLINDRDTFWVADNETGVLTHYDINGNKLSPEVVHLINSTGLPVTDDPPTGIILNRSQGFVVNNIPTSQGAPLLRAASTILIATENGNIYGYNPLVDTSNAYMVIEAKTEKVYKGLAVASNHLYAADFFNNKIDVFDFNFNEISGFPFIDGDADKPLPPNFAPFNIVHIGNHLYVLYALQRGPDNKDDLAGHGHGYISIFNIDGTFVRRLVSKGDLDSPWALIVAPESFGSFANKLLVGNFGDGLINVYNYEGKHLGTLKHKSDHPVTIEGLWGLAASSEAIYFAAGPDDEENGLFGKIRSRR